MAKLMVVQEGLAKQGRLGPVAAAPPDHGGTTLRKDRDPPLVIDGPYAETKEQLLGFYIVDCEHQPPSMSPRPRQAIRAGPMRSGRSA